MRNNVSQSSTFLWWSGAPDWLTPSIFSFFSFTPSHRPAVALFRKPAPSPLLHRNISQPSFLNPDYFRSAPIPAQAQIRIRISYFHSPYYNIQGCIQRLPISFIRFHQSCFGPMFFLKPLFLSERKSAETGFSGTSMP